MNCFCCLRRSEPGLCPCVFTTCRRCLMCLTHCHCPERHARECGEVEGLDDPSGPFYGLAEASAGSEVRDRNP